MFLRYYYYYYNKQLFILFIINFSIHINILFFLCRIQTFSVFFIDGANFIEADDQNWTVYFL
jgi:hypothetical protein